MLAALSALSLWRQLSLEQQGLVGGQGADTRTVAAWASLVEGVAAFGQARRRALRSTGALLAALIVVLAVLILWATSRPSGGGAALAVAGLVAGLNVLVLLPLLLWLAKRKVPADVGVFTLPMLHALRDQAGGDARLWLALRCVPAHAPDDRWLEAALELPEQRFLHLSARDVLEDGGAVCWLRVTLSRTPLSEVHSLGENDPSASGMTREVAAEAAASGDPFSSTEMLALRTAHGIQLEMARLEAFTSMDVQAPPIADVVGEASERTLGGRSALTGPAPLLKLWEKAEASA